MKIEIVVKAKDVKARDCVKGMDGWLTVRKAHYDPWSDRRVELEVEGALESLNLSNKTRVVVLRDV